MKLLLDESIPRRLVDHFPDKFEIKTVPQMGWAGTGNGELLRLAGEHGFNALVTADQGIEHEQNIAALPISVIVMVAHRTRLQDLKPLVPGVVDALKTTAEVGLYRLVA